MIQKDISVKIPFLWGDKVFSKSLWPQINLIVGPNGSGKTLLAEQIASQFSNFGKKTTFLHSATINEDVFIKILSENKTVLLRVEKMLSNMLGKSIKLQKNGEKLVPIVINKERNLEYNMYKNECHGLKKIITLLVQLYTCKTPILILDEPELHLHPQFQSFFMNEIRSIAKINKDRMFFIITHSPFFVDLRTSEDLEGVIVCHVNSVPTTISKLSDSDKNLLTRFLPRFNPYHKQFFFSDNQIFVEGYTDQQIFTILLQSANISTDCSSTGIIDVGGKDELGVFFKVCSLLGTSPRIITDMDSLFSGKLIEEVCKDSRTAIYLKKNFNNYQNLYINLFPNIDKIANKKKKTIETFITLEKLIYKLEQMILKVGKTILLLEKYFIDDDNILLYIQKLENLNKKYENTEGIDTYKTVLLQGILKNPEKLKDVLPIPESKNILLILNLYKIILNCIETCRVYILPCGCIEHYYVKNSVQYMPISGKDKLFHSEYAYISPAPEFQLKKKYPVLIEILEKACRI